MYLLVLLMAAMFSNIKTKTPLNTLRQPEPIPGSILYPDDALIFGNYLLPKEIHTEFKFGIPLPSIVVYFGT